MRLEHWKYIRYFEQQPIYEELYDLKNDPHETVNLNNEPKYAKELDRLRKRCFVFVAKSVFCFHR